MPIADSEMRELAAEYEKELDAYMKDWEAEIQKQWANEGAT